MNATILALGLYRSSGGPSKSIQAFAKALEGRVISWVDPRQYERESLIWQDTAVVRGRSTPLLRQLLVPRNDDALVAERMIAASEIVSCHSFWRWHNIWLARIAARHKVPYWFVPHGGLDPYVLSSGRLAKNAFLAAARPFLTNAAAVVCATRREYEKLAHLVPGVPPIVLPWPLDDADFRDRDAASGFATRRTLGIPDDAFCLLYFGRLDPMKRPLETIDAIAEAGSEAVHLIVMGNDFGVAAADCDRRAAKRGVRQRVHVVGPQYGTAKNAYVDAADAYISLSHRENFNFTAAECLASSKPVILSPGNDLSGDLGPVDCGRMLTSIDDAPQAIRDLAGLAPSARRQLGDNGRRWAESNLRSLAFYDQIRRHAAAIAGDRA